MNPQTGRGPAARADGLTALTLGALQTLAFVQTSWLWPLQLLCLIWLATAARGSSTGRAAWIGWLFGLGWGVAGTWWLFISMHRYGGLAAPLAAAAVGLLSAALALYMALALALFARGRRGPPIADAALFALAWVGAELARGLLFTGFPWVASGYAQVDGPLAAWAPWLGVYGIGGLLAFSAALVAYGASSWWRAMVERGAAVATRAARIRTALSLLIAAGVWLLSEAIGPIDFTRPTRRLAVTLLQTNVAQDQKFAVEHLPAALAWVAGALRSAGGDLVIAPETAVPLLPAQLDAFDPGYWPALRNHFTEAAGKPAALVGVPLGDLEASYSNAVVGLGPSAPYRYDKVHLVPFGEFIPTGFRWFTDLMNIPLGDFTRGRPDAPSFAVAGERIAPNICYEDLFGEELALRFLREGTAPTMLANVSNIGWFGDTIAVTQHLNISRMRTLELQRPMLRATNTGATAIVDHTGRVTAQLAPFTRDVLKGSVEGRDGRTPYAVWVGRLGLWPLLIAAWALLLIFGWRPRR
ncbi:apolipoprotein N-acyltransferase [Aquabacterium humicola]|uniref:apolipoprotein N-acyltransferase n=1 Tax=Aquabacterium humicola TaxID=3237377 RepID=UPI0025430037|nr:apolipoprotein N-acyltransferase [Rubrivivax pictus]